GLIIRALIQYYTYYGDAFTIDCPTGSGRKMTLYQVAEEIVRRLASIFLRDAKGRRPVYGGSRKFQEDPHWRGHPPLHEDLPGDNGPASALATRRGGPASSPEPCTCSPPARGSSSSSSARSRGSRRWSRRRPVRPEGRRRAAWPDNGGAAVLHAARD